MTDYKAYLTKAVIKDKQYVSYRLLARAVKVHVNQAKEMLFEFYNSNKPSSIQATYLISGMMPVESKAKDEDEEMVDSNPRFAIEHESVNSPRLGFIITSQDSLDETKAKFSSINAIHIYSLGPAAIKDEEPLETIRETLKSKYNSSDPMGNQAPFGGIVCKSIKHQTGKLSRQHAAPTLVPMVSDKKAKTEKQTIATSKPKEQKPAAESVKAPSKPLPKRQQADFFKSFGGKKEPKKVEPKPEVGEEKPVKEDEPSQMQLDSDSDEEIAEPTPKRDVKKEAEAIARKKKEQEALAHMFDDLDEDELKNEDIEMSDAPPTPIKKEEEKVEEKEGPTKPESEPSPASSRPQSSHSDSKSDQPKTKKRGRRLISKPVTRRGADGYLETTEEKVWESYSEDEVEAKPAPKKTAASSGGAKKPAGKGQGNIMSFFSKK